MAIVKVYRLVYIIANGAGIPDISFSGWVRPEDKDSLIAYVNSDVSPIVIGWEEKSLDTEPF